MKMTALSANLLFHGYGDAEAPTLQEPDMTPITLGPIISIAGTAPRNCPTGGDWNVWCDCMYPAALDAVTNAKCKSTPLGTVLSFAPWTLVGRSVRGLPASQTPGGTTVIAGPTTTSGVAAGGSSVVPAQAPSSSDGIFGLPKQIAIVGGGLAAIGLLGTVAFVKKAKRKTAASPRPTQAPAMAGYRRRKRRR